jgi:glycerol uptake facilitator-like aquaporin
VNPLVSIAAASRGQITARDLLGYVPAQVIGAFLGTLCANAMFAEPLLAWSTHVRTGLSHALSEVVATFGLLTVIIGCWRQRSDMGALVVGAYVTAAIWFTASTAFANPG